MNMHSLSIGGSAMVVLVMAGADPFWPTPKFEGKVDPRPAAA